MFLEYDIIVVGAGHAGCEAASAAANLGANTLLITMSLQTTAQMSCNPAMGGIAKGQIVREIDALGGYSGIVTDFTMVQFRMLNRSKGPAMWSPRAQSDRFLFSKKWREILESLPKLDFYQDVVNGIIVKGDKVVGVKTNLGHEIKAKAVILTNGTFLNGIIHIGERNFAGGRISENAVRGITEQLGELGFESNRLKTGTPPRVDGRSLDYSKMEIQNGDEKIEGFSFTNTPKPKKQLCCWITYTSEKVHKILKKGFDRSPMFQGRIDGVGPRYCPSIEDKINRFADKTRHQLFVEPEGWTTSELYINGFSTSLPEEIQYEALRSVAGFENCKILRPGYAIEYDFFPPTQLTSSLETKKIKNLFFAGQINGTTGYEEAACQGLMAGINAVQKLRNKPPFVLKRSDGYIGVLIDDLITKGTDEPYRMFTSRAEFRTNLRQDNADLRLTPMGYNLGLIKEERFLEFKLKEENISKIIATFRENVVLPNDINSFLEKINSSAINEKQRLDKILLRPQINIQDLMKCLPALSLKLSLYNKHELEQAELQIKYETYIEKEKLLMAKISELESISIPDNFDYDKISSLGTEAKEKLKKIKPQTLGQAHRISGINPSDIQILLVFIGR